MHRAVRSLLRVGMAACAIGAVAMFPASRPSHAASNQITLTWQTSNDTFWLNASKTVIKAYTALHPNVTVNLEPLPVANYDQKLFLEAAASTLPDVIRTSDGETIPLAAHHILLDMQPFVNADPSFNVSDIYPTFLNLGRLPGQSGLYMMPFSADAVLVFYNKSMFDKAGLAYPAPNWTYQDFLNDAQKLTLTDSSGHVTQWGVDVGNGPSWWATYAPFMKGFGGSVLTPDGKHTDLSSTGSIAGEQALADLVLKYKVEPGPNVVFPTDAFISGHAAMYFIVHGAVAGLQQAIGNKFKWDVQTMPAFPNGTHYTGEGTAGWAVSAGSKNRAAAWDIVKFVGSVAGQTALAKLGVTMPIRKSMLTSKVWQAPGLNNQAFVQAINMGIPPPQLPLDASINCGTIYQGLMYTTITNMWQQILRGTPVATAAKAADAAINGCVDALGD